MTPEMLKQEKKDEAVLNGTYKRKIKLKLNVE